MSAGHHSMMAGKSLPYKNILEYIESSGTQYVNTGWVPKTNSSFKLAINVPSLATYQQIGCIQNNGKPYYNLMWAGNPNRVIFYFGNYTDSRYKAFNATTANIGFNQRCDITYDGSTGNVTLGDFSGVATTANTVPTVPFFLFARNNRGAAELFTTAKIYAFSAWDNGVKAIDLVPVTDQNGDAKLFDVVSSTYPAHFGSFTGGPIIG